MNTFIEKNISWLEFYSAASRILGWTMIFSVCLFIFAGLMGVNWGLTWEVPEERSVFLSILGMIIENTFNWLPVGIILLGVGQLIKFICEDAYKMPWLLRNGAKILYIFAVLAFSRSFIFYFYQDMMHVNLQIHVIKTIYFLLADILILVGLGNILKRVLPIIEEHKSLI
jgi:hypothetical protein